MMQNIERPLGEMQDYANGIRGLGPIQVRVTLTSGKALEALALNQTSGDMQLLGDDRRIHLLRKSGTQFCEVTFPLVGGLHLSPLGSSSGPLFYEPNLRPFKCARKIAYVIDDYNPGCLAEEARICGVNA